MLKQGSRALAVCAVLALAACASKQTASAPAPKPDPRWEAVFMPEDLEREVAQADPQYLWWETRRDSAMAMRVDGPMLATDEWPEPLRASLSDWQYLRLPQQPENVLYFEPGSGGDWPRAYWPGGYWGRGYWRRW